MKSKLKKSLSLLLALTMCLSCMSLSAMADPVQTTQDSNQQSTDFYQDAKDENLWHITSLKGLEEFRDSVNSEGVDYTKAVIQVDQGLVIDLADYGDWTPIGGNASGNAGESPSRPNAFHGVFDGNGLTIKNLTIDDSSMDYAGFFGFATGATIKNINMVNVSIFAKDAIGAIAGGTQASTAIDNCTVTGSILLSGNHYVGGIAGWSYANTTNCTVNGGSVETSKLHAADLTANSGDGDDVGGILGFAGEANNVISNCSVSNITIEGFRQVGGIAGIARDGRSVANNSVSDVVVSCIADENTVTNKAARVAFGGVVGVLANGSITSPISVSDNQVTNVSFTCNETARAVARVGFVTGGLYNTLDFEILDTAYVSGSDNTVTSCTRVTNTLPPKEPHELIDGTVAKTYVAQISEAAKFETLEEAFAAAQDGDTITLLADCAGNGIKAPQGRFGTYGLTVDFDSHAYTFTGDPVGSPNTEYIGFQLLKSNKITFLNGTIKVAEETTGTRKFLRVFQSYADVTLHNMTVDGTKLVGKNAASEFCNGTVNITGNSTFTAKDGVASFNVDAWNGSYPDGAHVTVNTTGSVGTVNCFTEGTGEASTSSLYVIAGVDKLTIEDGSTVAVTKASTFNIAAPAGYRWESNGENTETLAWGVAQIGNNKYASLEAAFAAAVDGDTITVLANCSGNGIKAPQGKFNTTGLTVDFGGHTYTMDGTLVGSTGTETQAFQLLKDNTITFKNGTLYSAKAKMLVQNYSNLTLDNMTLTLDNPNYAYAYTLSNNNGNVVIDDTTINANPAGGFAFDVCRYASYPSVNVTVQGNSQINGNVEISASNNDAKDGFSLTLTSGTITGDIMMDATAAAAMAATPEKVSITKAAAFVQDAPEDYKWVEQEDGTSKLVAMDVVAKIDTQSYESLQAAFDAVETGETIVLQKNVSLTDRVYVNAGSPRATDISGRYATTADNRALTLDLNGHNIDSTKNIALAGGSLTITGRGTISTTNTGLAPVEVRGTGDLTAKRTLTIGENVTLSGTDDGYGLNIFGSNNASTNVIEVNVNGTINGQLFILGNLTNSANEIVVNVNSGAKIDGKAEHGIALQSNATVNVNTGASVTGTTGIEVRGGKLNVGAATVTATAVPVTVTANGSGTTTEGAAIAVAQHNTKLPITVKVNNATLYGYTGLAISNPQGNLEVDKQISVTLNNVKANLTNNGTKKLSFIATNEDGDGAETRFGVTWGAITAKDIAVPNKYMVTSTTDASGNTTWMLGTSSIDTSDSTTTASLEEAIAAAVTTAEATTETAATTINVNESITLGDTTASSNITVAAESTVTVESKASTKSNGKTYSAQEITITKGSEETKAYVVSDGATTAAIPASNVVIGNATGLKSNETSAETLVNVSEVLAKAAAVSDVAVSDVTGYNLSIDLKQEPMKTSSPVLQSYATSEYYNTIVTAISNSSIAVFDVYPEATVATTTNGTTSSTSTFDASEMVSGETYTFTQTLGAAFANKTVKLTNYKKDGTVVDLGTQTAGASGEVTIDMTQFCVVTGEIVEEDFEAKRLTMQNGYVNHISSVYLNIQDQIYYTVQFNVNHFSSGSSLDTYVGDGWYITYQYGDDTPIRVDADAFDKIFDEIEMKKALVADENENLGKGLYACKADNGVFYEIRHSVYLTDMDKPITIKLYNAAGQQFDLYKYESETQNSDKTYDFITMNSDGSYCGTTNSYLTTLSRDPAWTNTANALLSLGAACKAQSWSK